MQVFKAFFRVLNKNKGALIPYVVVYLAITLMISNFLKDSEAADFSKVSLNVGIENQDQGQMGAALEEFLGGQNNVKKAPREKEALQDAMYYQELDYVLFIPEDFTEKFLAGEREELLEGIIVPQSRSSYLLENEIEGFLRAAAMYLEAGCELKQALTLTAGDMEQKAEVNFLEEGGQEPLPGSYYFFQYIPYVFLVLMILGSGCVMKTFQNKDLAARNKCSATSFFRQNMQLFLGCMVYTLAVYLVFMLAACAMTDMFQIQGLLRALNTLAFGFCALSVAWFSVQFVRNVAELNIMSNIFGLSFSFLGGVFVPLDIISEDTKRISRFVPSYWYTVANREIQNVTRLSDAGQVYQSILVVLVFALAFFAAGLLANRMKVRTR